MLVGPIAVLLLLATAMVSATPLAAR